MPATVTWTLSGIEATDYATPSAATGTFSFSDDNDQTLLVAIADDDLNEAAEMLTLTLSGAAGGGGTGTGAAPVVAEVAREIGALTVAVVSRPFDFEGKKRRRHAESGLEELQDAADTLIAIPNQQLVDLSGRDTTLADAFKLADEVLLNAVKGISDVITEHGLVNVDFADVRTVMNEMGTALMGAGIGVGENRARDAAHAAVSSPLLKDISMDGARGVLINVTGGPDMTLFEVNEAATQVEQAAHEDANIIFGAVIDEQTPAGELHVTVIATGLGAAQARRSARREREAREAEAAAKSAAEAADAAEESAAHDETHAELQADEAPFESPFEEDDLDVPTFLRRGKRISDMQAEAPTEARPAEAPLRRQSNG